MNYTLILIDIYEEIKPFAKVFALAMGLCRLVASMMNPANSLIWWGYRARVA